MKHTLKQALALFIAVLLATLGPVGALSEGIDLEQVVSENIEPPVEEAGPFELGDLQLDDGGVSLQEGLTLSYDEAPEVQIEDELPEDIGGEAVLELGDTEAETPVVEETEPTEPFDQAVTIDGAVIAVTAEAGVFPEGAALRVEAVNSEAVAQAVEAAVGVEGVYVHRQYRVEIVDGANNVILPDYEQGVPAVRVEGLDLPAGSRVAVYDETVPGAYEIDARVNEGAIVFELVDVGVYDIFTIEPPTEAQEEAPAEGETEEPAQQPAEGETEESAQQPTEGETEEPTEQSAEGDADEPAEGDAEEPAEGETEEPVEQPAEGEAEESTEGETEEESTDEVIEEPVEVEGEAIQPVSVVFDAMPETAVVMVWPAGTEEVPEPEAIPAQEDGSFLLLPGEYVYTAEAEGYVSLEAAPFTVTGEEQPLMISFEMEAVAEKIPEPVAFDQSMTVNGVVVTVKADPGVFPADAVLSVARVPVYKQRQADAAIEDVRDEDQNVVVSYTFDIKVIDPTTGEEYQPAEGQTVSVSFALSQVADENLTTNVYHIDDSGEAEKLAVTQEDEVTATVQTDGFSLYTVEFTYNDLQFVMPGHSQKNLSEIMNFLGLVGAVTAVEVSDDSLFTVMNIEGEWIVSALRAFSTDEWMRVEIGGVIYEIAVTDDAVQDAFDDIFYSDEPITYVDENGQKHTTKNYTFITPNTTVLMGGIYVPNGTSPNMNEMPQITLYNNAVIVLGLPVVTKGIFLSNYNLTIYKEVVGSDPSIYAGEEGIYGFGQLTLCSGSVDITREPYSADHPMFGAEKGTYIKGGSLVVNGGNGGTLGGPYPVEISGGRVIAFSYGRGAAIGGGSVTITGGTVDAFSNCEGAAIGGGYGQAGNVTITGGTVNAQAQQSVAIGNGQYGWGGSITITGGTVNAKGQVGIGGTYDAKNNRCSYSGPIAITGGNVTATPFNSRCPGIASRFVAGAGLTLGWTNPSDRITGNFISGQYDPDTVTLRDYFWLGKSGVSALNTNLDGRTLVPSTTPNSARVKYYADGAASPWWEQTVGLNSTLTDPGNPYDGKAGYRFTGWKLDGYSGGGYSFGAPVTGDLNLYAAYQYEVTLKYGNGQQDAVEYVNPGAKLTKPANPTQNAATFKGWRRPGESADYDFNSDVNAPLTLEARWEYQGINYEGGHTNSYTAMSSLSDTTLTTGDYVVTQNTEIAERLAVSGAVNLILCDGATLTAPKGITVNEGNTLNIYGQSGNTGKLRVDSAKRSYAGIGSTIVTNSGQINIYGGDIEATGGQNAAGIGGGLGGTGTVTIYGGKVKGTGTGAGAGIGGGYNSSANVAIYGGEVTGIGGGTGIGSGSGGMGNVTIHGGEITARGGSGSAGIGGGERAPCTVTITGGTIKEAAGGSYGAGIGSGSDCETDGIVIIRGGVITARGGEGGAGIGSGRGGRGTVTIHGGDITASRGNKWSADIGAGGGGSSSGSVTFKRGEEPIIIRNANMTNPTFEQSFMLRDTGELADFGNMTGKAIVPCHALRFDANGGEGEMATVAVGIGRSIAIPDCDFTAPEDKVFVCWRTEEGAEYLPGQTVTPDGDLNLKALWLMPQALSFASVTDENPAGAVETRYGVAPFANAVTGAQSSVTWYSSDSTVARVDASTGEVTLAGVGTTTIHATAARSGDYAQTTASYPLTVLPRLVENPTVIVTDGDFTYTGAEITPAVTVTDGDVTIPAGEYVVSYQNNVRAGTATVIVTDKAGGNYDFATATQSFEISKKPVTVSGIAAKNKHYDNSKSAELDFSGATFNGLVNGDQLTASADGKFEDADYGENKTVSIMNLEIGGRDANNYILAETGSQTTATATIYAPHTVRFVSEDGQTALSEQNVLDGTTANMPDIEAPVKNGYRFVGWQDSTTEEPFDFSEPLSFENTTTVTLKPRFSKLYAVFAQSELKTHFRWKSVDGTGEAASENITAIEGEIIAVWPVPEAVEIFTGFSITGQMPTEGDNTYFTNIDVACVVKQDRHGEFVMPACDTCISGGFAVRGNALDALRDADNANLYHIRSANDLMLLMQWKGKDDYDLEGITLRLDNDIDMGGSMCTGFMGAFKGTFDGNGHTISNIRVNGTPSSNTEHVAFIWNLTGEVKNLTLTGRTTATSGSTGGLVGSIPADSTAKITNCTAIMRDTSDALVFAKMSGEVTGCYYGNSNSEHGTRLYTVQAPESSEDEIAIANVTGTNSRTIDDVKWFVDGSDVTMNITARAKEHYTLAGFSYWDDSAYEYVNMTLSKDAYTISGIHNDVDEMRAIYQYNIDLDYQDNKYLIKSVADLNKVVQAMKDTGGCQDMYFLLTTDLKDVSTFEGIAVGVTDAYGYSASFNGTFDGGGHTISGMTIASDADKVGFIGNLGGKLTNLTLENCHVTSEYGNAGMLAGYADYGNITDCLVKGGNVKGAYAGAISGSNVNGSNNLYTTDVTVQSSSEVKTPGECGSANGDINYYGNNAAVVAWTVRFMDGFDFETEMAAPQIVANHDTAQRPTVTNTPTHAHFTFSEKWYRNDGTEYTFNSTEIGDDITGDTILSAGWTEDEKIAVTLTDGLANGSRANLAVYKTDAAKGWALPACGFAAPTGKTFDKWSYNGAEYSVGDKITFSDTITVNATWKDADYTVTAQTVDHGEISAAATAHYGDTVTVTVTPDTGYELDTLTWRTLYGDPVAITAADGAYTFAMPADHVTLTATFKQADYTITVSNGLEHGSLWVNYAKVTDFSSPIVAHYGDTVQVAPEADYALATLTVTDISGGSVEAEDGAFTMPARNVTVSATFTSLYTVAISDAIENGVVTADKDATYEGDTVTLTVEPEDGYVASEVTFNETTIEPVNGVYSFDMPDGNVTVSATFAPLYTVSFNSNGGSAVDSQNIVAGGKATKPDDPTKDGYRFLGWYNGETAFDFGTAVSGDITLTAHWQKVYAVTFAAGEGGSGSMDAVNVDSGTNYTLPACAFTPPEGKVFKEWTVKIGDAEAVSRQPDEVIEVTADTTVTAVWEEKSVARLNLITTSFKDKLQLNFYYKLPKSVDQDEGAYLQVTHGSTSQTILVKNVDVIQSDDANKNGCHVFSYSLEAKQARDNVNVRLFSGSDTPVETFNSSGSVDLTADGYDITAMAYLNYISENGSDGMKTLALAAKDYCTASQLHFHYNVESIDANDGVRALVDQVKSSDLPTEYASIKDGEMPDGADIDVMTVMFESDNSFRLYYTFADAETRNDYSYAVDGSSATLKKRSSDGAYYIEKRGVSARLLHKPHTYAISRDGKTYTLTASMMTYALVAMDYGTDSMKTLAKAFYLYNQAAKAYFGDET